jgi:hypothetical protein
MSPLIPDDLRTQLLRNGETPDVDHPPIVKLFDPAGSATWLLSAMLPDNPDLLFGLCDIGMGFPELGYVSLQELRSLKGRLGLGIDRDLFFEASFPLSIYTEAAQLAGAITESERLLREAAAALAACKREFG